MPGSALSFRDKWLDFLFSEGVNFDFFRQQPEKDVLGVLPAVVLLERGLF